jgi:excisionase family DNA binding protein
MNDALALRAGEAARLLRISTRFLAQLTREGKIPHKRVGRAILYPVEELREWLRRCPGPDGSEATHARGSEVSANPPGPRESSDSAVSANPPGPGESSDSEATL